MILLNKIGDFLQQKYVTNFMQYTRVMSFLRHDVSHISIRTKGTTQKNG